MAERDDPDVYSASSGRLGARYSILHSVLLHSCEHTAPVGSCKAQVMPLIVCRMTQDDARFPQIYADSIGPHAEGAEQAEQEGGQGGSPRRREAKRRGHEMTRKARKGNRRPLLRSRRRRRMNTDEHGWGEKRPRKARKKRDMRVKPETRKLEPPRSAGCWGTEIDHRSDRARAIRLGVTRRPPAMPQSTG